MEPDQIDMMNESELRQELRKVVAQNIILKQLCIELLSAAEKCNEAPYYIIQPFMGIVKRYTETIERLQLTRPGQGRGVRVPLDRLVMTL